jgi:hypothetical protein
VHLRPLTDHSLQPGGTPMTTLQKKTDNPIAHLSADDIEQLG